jgi:hypothetical protein
MKISVVLREPGDWDEWMLIINIIVRRGNVKHLINSDLVVELKESKELKISSASNVKTDAIVFIDLNTNQQKDLIMLREDYKIHSRKYRKRRDTLKEIEQYIMRTIDC